MALWMYSANPKIPVRAGKAALVTKRRSKNNAYSNGNQVLGTMYVIFALVTNIYQGRNFLD